MSREEKIARTTPDALRARGIVIAEYNHWILARNEFPHDDRGPVQMVLRAKRRRETSKLYDNEFYKILNNRKDYEIVRHAIADKTIPFREHFHIFKRQ